jgi:hypothetical protein
METKHLKDSPEAVCDIIKRLKQILLVITYRDHSVSGVIIKIINLSYLFQEVWLYFE